MCFSVEILDHDPRVLRRELIGFSLKEGHDWTEETSGTDFNSSLGLSPEGKILFQHDTVLDRHMVGFQMAVIATSPLRLLLLRIVAAVVVDMLNEIGNFEIFSLVAVTLMETRCN